MINSEKLNGPHLVSMVLRSHWGSGDWVIISVTGEKLGWGWGVEREEERDRQTDRDTDRQQDTERERERDIQTDR